MASVTRLLQAFKGSLMLEECTHQELVIIANELVALKNRGFSPATCGIYLKGNKTKLLPLSQNLLQLQWLDAEPVFMAKALEPQQSVAEEVLAGDFRELLQSATDGVQEIKVEESSINLEASKLPSDDNVAEVPGFSTAELDDLWSGTDQVDENGVVSECVSEPKASSAIEKQVQVADQGTSTTYTFKVETAKLEVEVQETAPKFKLVSPSVTAQTKSRQHNTMANGSAHQSECNGKPTRQNHGYVKSGYDHVKEVGQEAIYNNRQAKVYRETVEKYSRFPDSGSGWGISSDNQSHQEDLNPVNVDTDDQWGDHNGEVQVKQNIMADQNDPWDDDADEDPWSQPIVDTRNDVEEREDDPWSVEIKPDAQSIQEDDPWADSDQEPVPVQQTQAEIKMSSGWGDTSRQQSPEIERGRPIDVKVSYDSVVQQKVSPPPGIQIPTVKFKMHEPVVQSDAPEQLLPTNGSHEEKTRIRVHPVPSHIKVAHINKLFCRFGVILFASIKNGSATVEYFEPSEAQAAYDSLHQGILFGTAVELQLF